MKVARAIDWRVPEDKLGAAYNHQPGHRLLPTRLMAGFAILKHTYDLSDEVLCERWVENSNFQYFCGEELFQHRLVFDRSSLTRWRQRMGEEKLLALMQESLATACPDRGAAPGPTEHRRSNYRQGKSGAAVKDLKAASLLQRQQS